MHTDLISLVVHVIRYIFSRCAKIIPRRLPHRISNQNTQNKLAAINVAYIIVYNWTY